MVRQELSTGMLGYNNALKIHNTPFPFPYVQLISVCLLVLTVSAGNNSDALVVHGVTVVCSQDL